MRPAAQLASMLLASIGLQNAANVHAVCHELGLRVREVDSTGFDGALLHSRGSQKGIIAVRRSIREASRKQFTIAHEIAHFVIPYHRGLRSPCVSRVVERFGKSFPLFELEANEFAAELVLPSNVVRNRFNLKDPYLTDIEGVAREFGTSLSATTYRYLDLTDIPCAMVWSEAGGTVWYHRSATFPFYIPSSAVPAAESVAGRILRGEVVPAGPHVVPADLWLGLRDAESVKLLTEESRYLPNYDAALSLLHAVKMDASIANDTDQEETLNELDPNDFTLRRRKWPR